MSLGDQIGAHVQSGGLVLYRLQFRQSTRRQLLLTRHAMQLLRDPHSAVGLLGGRGWIETAMTKWVSGGHVYGRRIAGRLRCGFVCRLSPPPPEIWEIRITVPIVRWRVFGRFAAPDTFIATSIHTRGLLGKRSSSGWAAAMKRCERAWEQLFPATMPFTAVRARDYITENCDDFEL